MGSSIGCGVAAHHPGVLYTMYATELGAGRWRKADPTLQALAVMRTAAVIGCTWCMDFGYWEYHHRGVDPAKLRAVPDWETSTVFTPLERAVLEYADAMTATPPTVTDDLFSRLLRHLGEAGMVELTTQVALANLYTRSNVAMGIESQGFSSACTFELTHRDVASR